MAKYWVNDFKLSASGIKNDFINGVFAFIMIEKVLSLL